MKRKIMNLAAMALSALLCFTAGAIEPTYTVTMKEGTEDAGNWTIDPAAATNTGVKAGTTITAAYAGAKRVKSVKAKKKAAASLIVNPEVGQVIGSDGKNYAANATLPTGVTAVAMIAYVGSDTGVEGYTHGLALALTDEGQMDWTDATGASGAAAHTPAAPTTTSSWMLPSKDQWGKMITAAGGYTALRDGFSGITGASNMQSDFYWASTEGDSSSAWACGFSYGNWGGGNKGTIARVRACLAF